MSDRRATVEKQILRKITRAKDNHSQNVAPKDKTRLQRFRSDKKFYNEIFPNLTQYSMSDTSVMSATERMTAQIIKMLFGNQDIGSMKGRNAEDDKNAETMQQLCNWQIEYANAGYQKFYWWVKECLYQLYSVVMVTQKREYERVEEEKVVPQGDEERFMMEAMQNNVDILNAVEGVDPQTGTPITTVTVSYMKLTANYPLIENVPSEELIWTPGSQTLGECELVGRRKQVTIDYLVRNIRKKQPDGTYTGMYDRAKVMELVESGTGGTGSDESTMEQTRDNGGDDGDTYDIDDPNRKVWISECFAKCDINGDHKLEDCIFTVVEDGNIFIRYEENTDGFPFCIISPVFDPFKIVPDLSGIDALGQWQDLLTAIIRLTVQNLALNNNPQQLCNESAFLDFNQVLDGDAFLSINTSPADAMQPVAQIPLAPYTLNLIEMIKGWGEEASNINRYNQGMDAGSLNKLLRLSTPVPMADGTYKTMGSVVDGDMIIGGDGKPVQVSRAHEYQFPVKAYEIKFSSGDVICAGGEHLWQVQNSSGTVKIMTSDAIFEYMNTTKGKLSVPRVQRPNAGIEKDLPIDPYILGLWLGNGNAHTSRFTSMDAEVIDSFAKWAELNGGYIQLASQQNSGKASTYDIKGTNFRQIMRGMLLAKDGRYNDGACKHIPEQYLTASYTQRLELLRGLMDTDGCWSTAGTCIFCQSEGEVKDDFILLVESLGGWAHERELKVKSNFCATKKHYHITFNLHDNPFKLSRKANLWKPISKQVTTQHIQSIVEVPVEEMRCLTVASDDGLYCVGNRFTVTHNTATGITALINQGSQAMELIMRNIAETGMKQLFMRMVYLNQKYIDQEQVIRLTNKDLQVNKDNLKGDFDYIVNAGMGAGAKETDIKNMVDVISQMPTWIQGGIADTSGAYNAVKKYLELVGIRNVDDYIKDPQQAQQQPQQAPEKDNITANIKDAPAEIQAQFWAKQGFQATPEMFAKQQAEELEKERVKQEQQAVYGAGQKIIEGHMHPDSTTLGGPLNGKGRAFGAGSAGEGVFERNNRGDQQRPATSVI